MSIGKSPRITEHPSDVTVSRHDPVTLQCSADGNPSPIIEWYRDGEFIISSSSSASSSTSSSAPSRILLPGGALFFLRVQHSRKENDSGVYWCLARNSQGVARSRNATLTVARKSISSQRDNLLRVQLLLLCLLLFFASSSSPVVPSISDRATRHFRPFQKQTFLLPPY